ncbi:FxSxx-COOH cyclophane-containing RiPP peptide [Streptomyces sp. NBC_00872]|uniref:FxSxx-COOH cyclophane-containing RiPP peptide n=1 Tax=Streptomyces sp. NBC_00872 TaxID=2903686 RepID=UPI00386DE057|nr:FxSxx-COOH protein [Streptomyces sp. NBC_00872]
MSDVVHGAADGVENAGTQGGGARVGDAQGGGALPDLLALDLETLRTLDHPVLTEVVADLRGRAEQPREMLWGFNNAF